jgi:hypothetical protein
MTFQPTRRQRELELVSMLISDRGHLHATFREMTGCDPKFVFDRDIIRLILDREYPSEDGTVGV